jgi:hypothetical protein
VLHGITVNVIDQQQMDSVLLYLNKYGQHVDSIHLFGVEKGEEEGEVELQVELRQLPFNLQLSSLQLEHLHLQLQPGNGSHGVLGAAAIVAALKQLQLHDCELLDGEEQLAAALWQLPAGLEHLSISGLTWDHLWVQVPTGVLQQLQQLTYLELTRCRLKSPVEGQLALQPLQALTLLQDLRLAADDGEMDKLPADDDRLEASMLSGAQHLTRLEVSGCWHEDGPFWVEPGVLVGKSQLQHLQLVNCCIGSLAGVRNKAGGADLLSYLQDLQQLTHLGLGGSHSWEEGDIAPALTSALTASSKLQHLDISGWMLPASVWHHMFSTGRQLPHLRSLNITGVLHPTRCGFHAYATAPAGSQIVDCCPGLQSLLMQDLKNSAKMLPALHGLSGLHTLGLSAVQAHERLDGVYQLTGLRELVVRAPDVAQGVLLQLTQLKQLTALTYSGPLDASLVTINLACQVSCFKLSSVVVICLTGLRVAPDDPQQHGVYLFPLSTVSEWSSFPHDMTLHPSLIHERIPQIPKG